MKNQRGGIDSQESVQGIVGREQFRFSHGSRHKHADHAVFLVSGWVASPTVPERIILAP